MAPPQNEAASKIARIGVWSVDCMIGWTLMNREYIKWRSRNLGRDMEILIFGSSGARVIVFPTRMNRFYEYEDRGMVDALREHIDNGWVQLFCVDSVDEESLYAGGIPPRKRIERHMEYERYILDEVLPFSRMKNPNNFIVSHGCSLGAYHAMTVALRHPGRFSRIVAFSGRYDLTLTVPDFYDLFSGEYDEDVYFHQPSHFMPGMNDTALLDTIRRLEIVMVIGEEDPFFRNNWELREAFEAKQIPVAFHAWYGRAHRFRYWRQMARIYM